jgi:histidine triad (HIT) family protein
MCVFCDIARGGVEASVVFEDHRSIAFLDHRPLFPGHTLLIPRAHHVTLTDLPDELVTSLFVNARALARAMQEGLDATGSFVAVNNIVSQSVPHFHIHVVPRRPKDGLRGFFWPRTRYSSNQEREAVAERLRRALRGQR